MSKTLQIIAFIVAALLLLLEAFRVPNPPGRVVPGWLGLFFLAVALLIPLVVT